MPGPPVLVVGATRILRPAALSLAAAGHTVHAVARSAADLAALAAEHERVVPVVADWTDPIGFAKALAAHRSEYAVAYCPGASTQLHTALYDAIAGSAVHVLTSSAARPDHDEPFDLAAQPPLPTGWHRLVLGWTSTPPRWHSPAEISAAALVTLDAGEDRLLGAVRPWPSRPA